MRSQMLLRRAKKLIADQLPVKSKLCQTVFEERQTDRERERENLCLHVLTCVLVNCL